MAEFTHFKKDGSAVMVDVHEKPDTYRALRRAIREPYRVKPGGICGSTGSHSEKRRCARCGAARRYYGGEEECGVDSAVPHCAADEL